MKSISANMSTLLASDGIEALATFYIITRKDGVQLAFTDYSDDVRALGFTFTSAPGLSRSAMQQRADLAAPNFEVTGIVTSGFITDEDIRAGLYNSAKAQVWMAVPGDADFLTYGRIALPGAYIGQIKIEDGVYVLELRGLSYVLQQSYVEVFTPTCRADFCDTRCKLNASQFTAHAYVASVQSRTNFTYSFAEEPPATLTTLSDATPGGVFTFGICKWTSGKNAGYSMEIAWDTTVGAFLALYLPMPFPLTPGDTCDLLAGCDKTINACFAFNNVDNFRGEPFIPGMSFLFDYGEAEP